MVTKARVELVPLLKEKHAEHSCYPLHLAADSRINQHVNIGWPLNTHIAPDLLFSFWKEHYKESFGYYQERQRGASGDNSPEYLLNQISLILLFLEQFV